MADDISLSDIAAVMKDNDMNGGAWWIIILFVVLFGAGGLGGFGGINAATVEDIQRAVDLNSIQEGQANIQADIQRGIYEINGATKYVAYNNLSEIRDLQTQINAGFANQQTCCCGIERAIDGVNYNAALNTASINANTTSQTQKILDALNQNKVDALQGQISQLQLQNAMAGVVRYPNATTYTAGYNPYFQASACGGNVTF